MLYLTKINKVYSYIITFPTGCQVGQSVRDRCDQLCICSSSRTMVHCTRIRKEFTSMTADERKRYVRAVTKVSTDPR